MEREKRHVILIDSGTIKMLAVKNFFMPEKRVDSPRFSRMPEALMRSIRRRSLRVKRTKSLVLVNEKRKSGEW